jgi:carboxymethylenebutenolidase
MNRRDAVTLLTQLVGVGAVSQWLAGCHPAEHPAPAPPRVARSPFSVAPHDPAISASVVHFSPSEPVLAAYLARPAHAASAPGVLVCHAAGGLTPHFEDVTRRFAKAGYVAMAVDLLSREGGTIGVPPRPGAETSALLGNAPEGRHVGDFIQAFAYLRTQPFVRADRIGMVGFCLGGGMTWRVAVAVPELVAAVPFYGVSPPVEDAPKIHAAVLAIYAERDQVVSVAEQVPPIEAAMQAAGKTFQKIVYPGVDHAFHDDTGSSWNEATAKAAWLAALGWLDQYLNRSA